MSSLQAVNNATAAAGVQELLPSAQPLLLRADSPSLSAPGQVLAGTNCSQLTEVHIGTPTCTCSTVVTRT